MGQLDIRKCEALYTADKAIAFHQMQYNTKKVVDIYLNFSGTSIAEPVNEDEDGMKLYYFVIKNNSSRITPSCQFTFSKPGFTKNRKLGPLMPGREYICCFSSDSVTESIFITSISVEGASIAGKSVLHGFA